MLPTLIHVEGSENSLCKLMSVTLIVLSNVHGSNFSVKLQALYYSNNASTYALVKYYLGLILSVFKILNLYLPKSNMGVVHLSNGPSPPSMMCLDVFIES